MCIQHISLHCFLLRAFCKQKQNDMQDSKHPTLQEFLDEAEARNQRTRCTWGLKMPAPGTPEARASTYAEGDRWPNRAIVLEYRVTSVANNMGVDMEVPGTDIIVPHGSCWCNPSMTIEETTVTIERPACNLK